MAAMIVPLALVFSMDDGIWKRVVEPVFDIEKSVEVEKVAVVEAMVKTLPYAGVPVAEVTRERRP